MDTNIVYAQLSNTIVNSNGDLEQRRPKRFRPFKYLTDKDTVWDNYILTAVIVMIALMIVASTELQHAVDMQDPELRAWRNRQPQEKTKEELEEDMKRRERMTRERSIDSLKAQKLFTPCTEQPIYP
jgi:hypothetical protein